MANSSPTCRGSGYPSLFYDELDFKTRMGRNCDTGTLNIVVLEEPEEVKN